MQHDELRAMNSAGFDSGSDVSDDWILVQGPRPPHAIEASNDVDPAAGADQHSVQYSWRQMMAVSDQLQLKLRTPEALWAIQQTTRRWRQFAIRLLVRQRLPRATSREHFFFWEGVLEDLLVHY